MRHSTQIIWQKCPKATFVSRDVLELGVCSAVINYNDGLSVFETIFEKLDMLAGKFFIRGARDRDVLRIKNMDRKSKKRVKSYRERN